MSHHHGVIALHELEPFCFFGRERPEGHRFGRMFDLAPLDLDVATLEALGAKGGPMDGGTGSGRTATVDVGQVFFGQFIDHDITLDVVSSLDAVAGPETVPNARTPTLDLDCVYGQGPEAAPHLYHGIGSFQGIKLLVGADGTAASQTAALAAEDLVRSPQGTAVIGDPRNDENRIVSQLQLAMLRFHNHVVDVLHADPREPSEGAELFERARQVVTWHYQWVVLHDFLPAMCGGAVVADILGNGRRLYCAPNGSPFIPVEFSVAAFRFGHAMVPQKIQVQAGGSAYALFGPTLGQGFVPLADADAVVDWNELVTTSSGAVVQKAEKLDAKLASILLALPFITDPARNSLATRNLLRGQALRLPSGENAARALGIDDAGIATVSDEAQSIAGGAIDLSSGTPLWFYILVEAGKIGRETTPGDSDAGEGLGPLGARIIAETLIGLMEMDPRSLLGSNRNWAPSDGVGVATLGEMLTYTP